MNFWSFFINSYWGQILFFLNKMSYRLRSWRYFSLILLAFLFMSFIVIYYLNFMQNFAPANILYKTAIKSIYLFKCIILFWCIYIMLYFINVHNNSYWPVLYFYPIFKVSNFNPKKKNLFVIVKNVFWFNSHYVVMNIFIV